MTWSCERDACGSARPEVDAVQPFATHRSGKTESRSVRQGISSTDKDVTDSHLMAMMAGGFSFSPCLVGTVTSDLVHSSTSRGSVSGLGRRVSRWSVRSRSGQRRGFGETACKKTRSPARQAVSTGGFPEKLRSKWFTAPPGRCRGDGHVTIFRSKEVLPPCPASAGVEGRRTDPATIRCRAQQGIRQE